MKKQSLFRKLLLAIIVSIPLSLSAIDTRGTDFWLTFGPNLEQSMWSVNLQIRIAGAGQAATGNIHFTELGTSVPFSVTANGVFTHDLTWEEMEAAYHEWEPWGGGIIGGEVTNRSVRITSSAPVMVYALNQGFWTTDATNLLPVPVLGTDHFQISYTPLEWAGYPDIYSVIAVEDNTRIYHDGIFVATLNTGQVYIRFCYTDMTGIRVTSDKPVAFFTMNYGINVPVGHWAADVQFQQLPPVNTWGRNFFIPVTHVGVERVRIVASQDGTDIETDGVIVWDAAGSQNRLTNLNAGQWVELEVSLANGGAFIQTNNPVGVCSYMVGLSYPGNLIGDGDPSTAWIPAIEQMVPSAAIAPFIPMGGTALHSHFALVVVQTSAKDQTLMSVGGGAPAPISGGVWHDHPTAGYSFYILQLPNDATVTYTFANPEGLLVMGYGLGDYESYYYVAGSAFRTLDVAFFANDIHNQELAANVMRTNQINFRAEIQGDMSSNAGHIRWLIDGVEETSARDQLTWSRNLPNGTYLIVLEVLMDDNITVRRVEGTLIIATATIKVNPHINKRVIED